MVEAILAQCNEAEVIFFFKQWGGKQKKKVGRTLHHRTYDASDRYYLISVFITRAAQGRYNYSLKSSMTALSVAARLVTV